MLTSFRGLATAIMLTGLAWSATASAQTTVETDTGSPDVDATPDTGFSISGNVALTTDYRFRGVSLSAGDPAIQGGIDIGHESGFYVGTWASSIEGGPAFGEMELDIYGGYSKEFENGVTVDVGLLYYLYPTDGGSVVDELGNGVVVDDFNVNYFEPYASAGFALGPASATVGVAYAWDQDSLGGDNVYLYSDLEAAIPNTPITVAAHLGYTDGVLAPPLLAGSGDDTGFDYSIGASASDGILSLGVSYVGVEGPSIDGFTDDAVVATLSANF